MTVRDTEVPELTAFDGARDGFVASLAAVPEGALGYLLTTRLVGSSAHVNALRSASDQSS